MGLNFLSQGFLPSLQSGEWTPLHTKICPLQQEEAEEWQGHLRVQEFAWELPRPHLVDITPLLKLPLMSLCGKEGRQNLLASDHQGTEAAC